MEGNLHTLDSSEAQWLIEGNWEAFHSVLAVSRFEPTGALVLNEPNPPRVDEVPPVSPQGS